MPANVPTKLRSLRGNTLLGLITLDPPNFDFPWFAGIFHATLEFADVRPLFERELFLLNSGSDLDGALWEIAWEAICEPGLHLLGPDDTPFTADPLIHIDGIKAWWR